MTWTGTGLLLRHGLRRDRALVGGWLVVLLGVCYASASATASLYPTVREQVSAAETINASPAIVALYGPILDVHSVGELAMTKMTVLYAVFVAIMFLVVVRRHTRTDEESGRAELLGGTAIGRNAPMAASVLEGAGIALALGLLAAVVDVVGGLPVRGSLFFGASWFGIGLVATGLTAVACQLSASARTCAAITGGALGVLFLVRAVGDTSIGWLSWLSPFGWSTQLRAWSDTRWWVLLLYPVAAGLLVALAQTLRAHRDLGSGLVAVRPGPATGSPRLTDAISLSVRVHGPMIAAWTGAVAVLGLVLGAIAPNIGDLLDSPAARRMMERVGGVGALQDTLLAAELSISAVVITCFAIAVVGHTGADEQDGRTEQVLATATSRSRAFLATLLVAGVGGSWLLLVTGVATTLGFGASGGAIGDSFGRILAAALVQAPAVWLVTALALASFALRSSWTFLGWSLLVLFLMLGQVGELLKLPGWVIGLSPYGHVPKMPVESFALAPTLVLSAIAAALCLGAWGRYRTRDIG
jgi:ABC-2 type transport system permease protein